ncbi:21 kDa protein [Dorcoceras hygrometricum]|uniref:21 kDa protein n=1 Tax=Dorcoceras hygrometricum TaxID=472368 RepID=A0A2Z7A0M1_9LAMI|nr:21 kDa protein [Dorcoceras hygrometricum]KZV41410.1 21 kDa protein [Dorcoceras hygrometricum]
MEISFRAKSFALALLFITLLISSVSATRSADGTTSVEFIKASCSVTAYPRLCYASLSTQATAIQQSPRLLADAALSVSLNTARSTAADMAELLKLGGLRPREGTAIRECMEQLADSVDRLRRSTTEMTLINRRRSSHFWLIIGDIQTWVSAALTDEDTCMDGFSAPTTCEVKTAVREKISRVARMTSNALALVNHYAAIHG